MTASLHRLLPALAALGVSCAAAAQVAADSPTLVVSVVIDQLRSDYLEAFAPLYGEGGFQRLLTRGRVYTEAEYPFAAPDRASAAACLASGCSPYENGVPGEKWLDRQTLTPVYCVDDPDWAGHLTADKTSPRHLRVSTLGDELKIATGGKGVVLSVAPTRDAAVLSAGHAADGAYWIDDATGAWAGSSYYGPLPEWAAAYDRETPLSSRVGKMSWAPLNELVRRFNYFARGGEEQKAFAHKFGGERKYRELKASAMVNDEVNRFVGHVLKSTALGVDEVPDILCVTYYAGGFDHGASAQTGMETQDTYARLDRQLEELFDMAERRAGQGKTLFVVTGTGYSDSEEAKDLSQWRVPTGTFSITRAQLLLNMYLIAVYGPGQYVETSLGNQLYLNLKLIESRSLSLREVLERSADFLIQLSGVKDVYTSQRLALGAATPGLSRLRNAYNPKCSGDILVQVSPGWTLSNEDTHERSIAREGHTAFPLALMGCGVRAETVREPVSVDRVAPTLAKAMRIRAPNACQLGPLTY